MTHPTTDALWEAIGPAITSQDPSGIFKAWLDGPTSLLGEVDDVVRDSDTALGWSAELTAETTHRTRWTGQLLGVRIPDGLNDAQQRALILDRPATRRGTLGALVGAAQQHLTGSRYVNVIERDGSAYALRVQTYTEETPDPAAVLRALLEQKPAGLVLTYEDVTMTSFTAIEAEAAQTYTALEATAAETYTALEG